MRRPWRAAIDPTPENVDLFFGQLIQTRISRRHAAGWILRSYPLDEDAGGGVPRHNRVTATAQFRERALLRVKTQIRLPGALVGPVAGKATLGKNGTDQTVIIRR
ncbi:hypothetical protein D3C83_44120 [compost metagenome]